MGALKKKYSFAIIGGGWCGIGCLGELIKAGHDVALYEKNDDVGGTWHPSNYYCDLKIHAPSYSIEYPDFPLPSHIDRLEKLSAAQVYDYIKSYCKFKKFYEVMNFNCQVEKVNYLTQENKIELFIRHTQSNTLTSKKYDYIIYANGFSERTKPYFKGQEDFLGQIIHSLDATETTIAKLVSENKNITVLGGSKAATDVVQYLATRNYKATWLYKAPYWFLRFDSIVDALKKRASSKWYTINLHRKFLVFGFILAGINLNKLSLLLWKFFRIIDSYNTKKPYNFKKFHLGILDDKEIKLLNNYSHLYSIQGEIEKLQPNGILLNDKRFIKTDVLICCTGSGITIPNIEVRIDNNKVNFNKVFTVYHGRIIPAIPRLIFADHFIPIGSIYNGILQGKWIVNYVKKSPSTKYLLKHSTKYEIPFFHKKQFIFNSQDYVLKNLLNDLDIFFLNDSLSEKEFLRGFLDIFYQGSAGFKAEKFNEKI
ncbi:flavin containing monooxygenae [Legionella beliardensis]|uniref:Flavin containing monooxygenae n=1 Tax=Legionella beliardensis TaxID=91822 RepID=A0A378I2Q5_9GAMM|nr:FAD-dependent oxidoreductase [Legionella beliardensis]STX28981.1 flavin containing monooxygenae [Legionella beliardensis]